MGFEYHRNLTGSDLHDPKTHISRGKDDFSIKSGDTVVAGTVVYMSSSNEVGAADATDNTKPAIGVCISVSDSTPVIRVGGLVENVITVGDDDITAGDLVFLSTTAGKVTKTAPSSSGNIVQYLGRAISDESSSKVNIFLAIDYNPMEF